jgi:hypothetical protein
VLNVQAKASDYIVMHLTEVGNTGLVMLAMDETDANLVHTRQIMYLPPRDTVLLLNPSR